MAGQKQFSSIYYCLLLVASGCGGSRVDITQTVEVQRSGVLGRYYETRSISRLIDVGEFNMLELPAAQDSRTPKKEVGTVEAGTLLVTNRVVKMERSLGFPFSASFDYLFAMILDGPYAGKEVYITNGVLGSIPESKVLTPTTRPANAY